MGEERDRGIPLKIDVKKPPPPPTLESKIDPKRKEFLDSLSLEESIYVYRKLKEKVKETMMVKQAEMGKRAEAEETHSPLYEKTSALFSQIQQRTFRPDEMVDLAEMYTTMGFNVPHPEELKELTPEEIRELGLDDSFLVKRRQGSIFGTLLADRALDLVGNFLNKLASSKEVQGAIANFLNTLAKEGGKKT